jgi:hypothetical protein
VPRSTRSPSTRDVAVVDTIAEVEGAEALASAGRGAFLSPTRLRQLERDSRWETRYVVAREAGVPRVLVPTYASLVPRLAIPAYAEELARLGASGDAREWLLVGGRADYATSFLTKPAADALPQWAAEGVRDAVRSLADAGGRRLAALFVPEADLPSFRALVRPGAREERAALEAALDVAPLEGYAERFPRRIRSTIRGDLRKLSAAGIVRERRSWDDVGPEAVELIGAVRARHGVEPAPLIELRLDEWRANDEVDRFAITASVAGEVVGVSLGWQWRDVLQLYEMGLAPNEGQLRLLAYVATAVYGPLELANERGCSRVTLGLHATETKERRGARIAALTSLVEA